MYLDSTGNLARAQATAASMNVTGFSVNNSLYSHNIGLPSSVGTPVRVGNFDSESDAFVANIAFCHENAPP